MSKEAPHVGGAGPIVAGTLPKQPRRVVLEARSLAESLGASLVFAFVQPNSYLVEWELKKDIHQESLNPKDIDQDMEAEVAEIMAVLESCMDGSKTEWSLKVLAGDPGKAITRLADCLHARMIVVGTRHKGVGAKLSELLNGSTASHVISKQNLPVVVIPVSQES